MKIVLIRHGNTFEIGTPSRQIGCDTDIPLTTEGADQAKRLAETFKNEEIKPSAIYCGPLKRHRETAQVLVNAFKAEEGFISNVPALTELSYGAWEGKTVQEIQESWPKEYKEWIQAGTWPKHIFEDNFNDRIELLQGFISKLRIKELMQLENRTVFVVTSGGIIRLFNRFIPGRWNMLIEQRMFEATKVSTGSYSILELSDDSLEIDCWNSRP